MEGRSRGGSKGRGDHDQTRGRKPINSREKTQRKTWQASPPLESTCSSASGICVYLPFAKEKTLCGSNSLSSFSTEFFPPRRQKLRNCKVHHLVTSPQKFYDTIEALTVATMATILKYIHASSQHDIYLKCTQCNMSAVFQLKKKKERVTQALPLAFL